MNRRRKRIALLLLLLLFLLLWLCWNRHRTGFWFGRAAAGWFERFEAPAKRAPAPPVVPAPPPAQPAAPARHERQPPAAPHPAVPVTPAAKLPVGTPPAAPATPPPAVIPPGQEGMHRELIPKTITVVRCYYDRDVVAPDTTFEFDINGSGFTEEFHQMITL